MLAPGMFSVLGALGVLGVLAVLRDLLSDLARRKTLGHRASLLSPRPPGKEAGT